MTLLRLRVLTWIFAALFAAVEGRLIVLQFCTRGFWESEASSSRTGGRPVPFNRGSLLDRYGRPIAEGETVHRLSFVFQRFRRDTPAGLLMGAGRLLLDARGEGGLRPTLREIVEQPAEWIDFVLGHSARSLRSYPGYSEVVQADFEFYAQRLLGLKGEEYRVLNEQADDPARTVLSLVAGGRALVQERLVAQISAIAELADAIDARADDLFDLVDAEVAKVDAAVARAIAFSPNPESAKQTRAIRKDYESRPRVLARSVPYRAVYLVNLVPDLYEGFEIRDVQCRSYPEAYADLSPTLIGWVGFPTDAVLGDAEEDWLLYQELLARPPEMLDVQAAEHLGWLRQQIRHVNYMADEEQGATGLEALLEPVLRGRRGWQVVEQDSAKRDTRLLEMTPPIHGLDVRLTLDADLQLACQRVLARNGVRGAIALVDPRDGAIRALASYPCPTRLEIQRDYGELATDPAQPLLHRAYRPPGNPPPPGSVFKVVAAAAGLQSGKITAQTPLECTRYLDVGQTRLKCMGSHGSIELATALEKSCNIYFYRLSRIIGLEPMIDMASRFGLGEATGFGDPERLGLPPGARSIGEIPCPFQSGRGVTFAMRTAIGHAAVDDVTPLQVAAMMAVIGNGGKRVRPWLIDTIGDQPAPRDPPLSIGLAASTVAAIRQGMIAAAETGTARPRGAYDLRPYRVAAKTGTPQAEGEEDHAWIAGFFPYDDPQIAFSVFLENVGMGGGAAGTPVIGELLQQPEFEERFRP